MMSYRFVRNGGEWVREERALERKKARREGEGGGEEA